MSYDLRLLPERFCGLFFFFRLFFFDDLQGNERALYADFMLSHTMIIQDFEYLFASSLIHIPSYSLFDLPFWTDGGRLSKE